MKEVKVTPQRAVVAAVQLPTVSDVELAASLDELRELAKTLGFEVVATFTQKRASFDAGAYVGAGKREEIRRFVQGEADESGDAPQEAPAAAKRKRLWAEALRRGTFRSRRAPQRGGVGGSPLTLRTMPGTPAGGGGTPARAPPSDATPPAVSTRGRR